MFYFIVYISVKHFIAHSLIGFQIEWLTSCLELSLKETFVSHSGQAGTDICSQRRYLIAKPTPNWLTKDFIDLGREFQTGHTITVKDLLYGMRNIDKSVRVFLALCL